jgi:thiol-disulfide isomerase/thioredoxin
MLAAMLALATSAAGAPPDSARPAPQLALRTLDGTTRGLESAPDRLILVHFFATWCEPCRDEMAALDRLSAHMKDRLVILAVDVGEPEVRVRRFFDTREPNFPILLEEDRAAMKRWGVNAFPTSFLVDGTGGARTIRLTAAIPVDWDDPAPSRILERLVAGEALGAGDTLPETKDQPSGDSQ